VAHLAIAVDGIDALIGIDEIAVVVVEVVIVEVAVIGIVDLAVDPPAEQRAGVSHVEISELPFDRQRGLNPAVLGLFGIELHRFKFAKPAFLREAAIRDLLLAHQRWRDRPIQADIGFHTGLRQFAYSRSIFEHSVPTQTGAEIA